MKVLNITRVLGVVLTAAMAVSVGCGKKNESGRRNTNPYFSQFGTFGPGQVPIPGGVTNPAAQALFQSPCANGQQRIGLQLPLNLSVSYTGTYIGITSEGDIALVTNNGGGGAIMSAYICFRPEFGNGQGGQPQLSRNPVINRSLYCQVDEITAASMYIQTYIGYPLTLNFRPIHYGGPANMNQIIGQICRSY